MIPKHVAAFCAGVLSADSSYPERSLAELVAVLGLGRWSGDQLVSAAAGWAKDNVPDGYEQRIGAWLSAQESRKAGRS